MLTNFEKKLQPRCFTWSSIRLYEMHQIYKNRHFSYLVYFHIWSEHRNINLWPQPDCIRSIYPCDIYLLNVNNGNTRAISDNCSKLEKDTGIASMTSFWYLFVNFDFTHCPCVSFANCKKVNAGWVQDYIDQKKSWTSVCRNAWKIQRILKRWVFLIIWELQQ